MFDLYLRIYLAAFSCADFFFIRLRRLAGFISLSHSNVGEYIGYYEYVTYLIYFK